MPINNAQVEQIMKAQLKIDDPPQRFPFTVTVALDSADMNVKKHIGALKRVSPPEPVHALLFCIGSCNHQHAAAWDFAALESLGSNSGVRFSSCAPRWR